MQTAPAPAPAPAAAAAAAAAPVPAPTPTDLKHLKDQIEALNQHHQIQILKIMTQCNVGLTENKNGSFVNLTNVDGAVISKITDYLGYVDEQETQLNEVENQKTELTKQFFKS